MIEKVTGIVIDMVRYSDRQNIVTLFTREQGRVALLVPSGNSKSARLRNASLMPLSVISADINFKPGRDLQFLSSFSRDRLWKDLYFNPVKSAIGLFMAEFMGCYVRQSPPDAPLWEYITASIARLDSLRGSAANFHLAFLIGFLDHAGIRPDLSQWREDAWFDMRGGAMTIMPPGHRDVVEPERAALLPLLNRMNLRTFQTFKFSAPQRRMLLHMLLRYYSLHFPGMANLKSPAILEETFS